ncbi:DUF2789 domain-containing protein [Xylophilus sp.]|uniref:DUF2789 domain-containing protein n=1 Tax=Xylophilus sp. TaxID=2653893 RepID=UPI0013B7E26B|nr:DUF2789 domain-containing protein [Xylophilus sp.]KAF1049276.1 MAG: hypothetical protein GAK38_00731 [Xylophilus sp.]
MSNVIPRMDELFQQLGLEAGEASIRQFIRTHQLAADVRIHEAPFWNEAQRQFLAEQFKADAAWAIVVDQLNEALHEDVA